MIRKYFLTPVLAFLIIPSAFAQEKFLSLDDVVHAARRGLTPEKLTQLQWIEKTESYSYVEKKPVETLKYAQAAKATPEVVVTLADLNSALVQLKSDTLDAFPTVQWTNQDNFSFESGNTVCSYNTKDKKYKRVLDSIPSSALNKDLHAAHSVMAYTIDNNLWVATTAGRFQITQETNPDIVNGVLVHREEFGIHKGTFWSPSGNMLAYYRMDQTMVTDYPIYELDEMPAKVKMVKYPMAGAASHHVTIGIYSVSSGKTIFLKTGNPPEQYLTNIAWQPDEKAIYVVVLNRDQNHLWMKKFNTTTGAEEAVFFEETDSAYVQPLNPMIWNKAGTKFIWQSRRDGFNHLYLYDNAGKMLKQLTKGSWEVTDFHGFNETGTVAFFTANSESPINRDVYSVDLNSGAIQKISSGNGVHKCQVSRSGKYVLDEFSGPGIPCDTRLIGSQGKQVKTLLSSPNPLSKYAPVTIDVFTIKNSQGDSLYCRMLKPAGFDSTRKYPVIVYVYGGPGINLITNNWTSGADMWTRYMTQRGFIVFTLENRGTPNRGKAFEQATFRKLGDVEMEDQIMGAKYLMKLHYIDQNRMGIYGWSYGGFMTISMMTRNPGIFSTAVAGGPVIDWTLYEVMYTERYMDTPETNPVGYSRSSLLNYIGNLKGSMMLIHGTSDDVVVWQHSLLYLRQAIKQNVLLDYFVYPEHEHNVTGRDRVHLFNKVSNYFFMHLK